MKITLVRRVNVSDSDKNKHTKLGRFPRARRGEAIGGVVDGKFYRRHFSVAVP